MVSLQRIGARVVELSGKLHNLHYSSQKINDNRDQMKERLSPKSVDKWLQSSRQESEQAAGLIIRIAMIEEPILEHFCGYCMKKYTGSETKGMLAGGIGAAMPILGTTTSAVPLTQLTLGQMFTVITTGVVQTAVFISNPFVFAAGVTMALWGIVTSWSSAEDQDKAVKLYGGK